MQFVIVGVRFDTDCRSFLLNGFFEADGSADVAVADYQNDSGTAWDQWDVAPTRGSFEVSLWEPTADDGNVMAVAGDVALTMRNVSALD